MGIKVEKIEKAQPGSTKENPCVIIENNKGVIEINHNLNSWESVMALLIDGLRATHITIMQKKKEEGPIIEVPSLIIPGSIRG